MLIKDSKVSRLSVKATERQQSTDSPVSSVTRLLSVFPLQMPVAVGPYGQTQPSCFDRVKMGFMMGFAVGMAAGAMFGTFSCLRIGMRGRELMGGVGKTMMQSGGTFGTFMAIGMGIRC
ncbi:hypothetical protein L3Q82_007531 [Scortum barcoo]|uniref:Uncharacterized protein n=1 Tax=Scortum barcoo TaxID=214431 RepID=A0ACB8WRG2_9TELE|nr:hypothetical protein L3Q82_007531 [Scortum barcoo]